MRWGNGRGSRSNCSRACSKCAHRRDVVGSDRHLCRRTDVDGVPRSGTGAEPPGTGSNPRSAKNGLRPAELCSRTAAGPAERRLDGRPWRAIGFTAGGSHSSNWRIARQAETEARATKGCAQFGRGACRVVSFSGQECIALATLIGSCGRRRWNLSFTAGRATDPQAQSAAIGRCYADERSQGRSQPRAVASADGR